MRAAAQPSRTMREQTARARGLHDGVAVLFKTELVACEPSPQERLRVAARDVGRREHVVLPRSKHLHNGLRGSYEIVFHVPENDTAQQAKWPPLMGRPTGRP